MNNFHDIIEDIRKTKACEVGGSKKAVSLRSYKQVCSRSGEGTFSSVSVCKRVVRGQSTRCLSVVKKYNSGTLCRERCVIYHRDGDVQIESGFYQLHRELRLLHSMSGRCPYIVELEDVALKGDSFFVFLEFAGMPFMNYVESEHAYSAFVMNRLGRSMYRMISNDDEIYVLCEDDFKTCMKQLLSALEFLRTEGIAHKDIKPENILLNFPLERWRNVDRHFSPVEAPWNHHRPIHVTLCDFNISERVPEGLIFDAQGTSLFTPPEVYSFIDKEAGVDAFARDAWSAGMVAYCMVAGYHPLPLCPSSLAYQINLLRMQDQGERICLPSNGCSSSPVIKRVIEGLLDLNPSTRLTAAMALEGLEAELT
jgi:serine/threonine protein kinase